MFSFYVLDHSPYFFSPVPISCEGVFFSNEAAFYSAHTEQADFLVLTLPLLSFAGDTCRVRPLLLNRLLFLRGALSYCCSIACIALSLQSSRIQS